MESIFKETRAVLDKAEKLFGNNRDLTEDDYKFLDIYVFELAKALCNEIPEIEAIVKMIYAARGIK